MTEWFVDTSYWLAFLNAHDEAHERCMELGRTFTGRLITTDWVLIELANALSRHPARKKAIALIDWLAGNEKITVVPANELALQKGLQLYRERSDKDWSLTDCMSFQTMTDRKITEALSADHHFEQAGFIALLK